MCEILSGEFVKYVGYLSQVYTCNVSTKLDKRVHVQYETIFYKTAHLNMSV